MECNGYSVDYVQAIAKFHENDSEAISFLQKHEVLLNKLPCQQCGSSCRLVPSTHSFECKWEKKIYSACAQMICRHSYLAHSYILPLTNKLQQICSSFENVLDSNGYSGTHIAASCGKNKVLSYLIANGARVNAQHQQTGNTALHYAVTYGHIDTVHLLLKAGADVNICNENGRSPLMYVADQQPNKCISCKLGNSEIRLQVYAWGSNSNYNLGLAKQYAGGIPECVDIDVKDNDDIIDICLNKYHTLFRSRKGKVFACGHGRGGRLGMDVQSSIIVPQRIDSFKIKVLKMAAGVDHSVFFTENYQVWTCGKNSYMQLGLDPPPEYLLNPEPLKGWLTNHPNIAKNITGVGAGAYHTYFWTNTTIVSFGLNGGQLGHPVNENSPFVVVPTIITSPRSLYCKFSADDEKIECVYVGDAAVLFNTNIGNMFVISRYETRRIISTDKHKRVLGNITKIACIGGTLDTKNRQWNDKHLSHHRPSPLTVAIMNSENKIFVWTLKLYDQVLPVEPQWQTGNIFSFCLNLNDIHIVTRQLQCYKLELSQQVTEDSPTKGKADPNMAVADSCCLFFSEKIPLPYLCRPYYIYCDPRGTNFFALQYSANTFTNLKPSVTSESTYKADFSQLYDKINEFDPVCDVVFETKHASFLSHAYIISYHSNLLYKEVLAQWDNSFPVRRIVIKTETADSEILKNILQTLYMHSVKPLHEAKQDSPQKSSYDKDVSENEMVEEEINEEPVSVSSPHRKTKRRKAKPKKTTDFQQNVLNVSKQLGFDQLSYKGGVLTMAEKPAESDESKIQRDSSTNQTFFRLRNTDLWDIWFQCKDRDDLLGAHRCILVARCQYFEIYFSTRWAAPDSESSDENVIQIPCSYVAFKAILDYLYTDGYSHMKNLAVELLCEILVMSNQYLIPRLQEICEVLLSRLITLKNCLDLLQFCHSYHAEKLLLAVQEFLAVNIQHYLPLRSFRDCRTEFIASFAEVYKSFIGTQEFCVHQDCCRGEESQSHSSNLHNITEDTNFCHVSPENSENSQHMVQSIWADTYSLHPSCSELQAGLAEDPSSISETAEDWAENFRSPKTAKIKKYGSGRKKPRSSTAKTHEGRMRRTSSSSLISSSSNSDGEESHEVDEEQFSFDDLIDRESKVTSEREEEWKIVGRKLNQGSLEEKLEDIEISEKTGGTSKVQQHDTLNIATEERPEVKEEICKEKKLANYATVSKNQPMTSQSLPIAFPSLQEAFAMEAASKASCLLKGKSSKMPKMPSLKKNKQRKSEPDVASSSPTHAWGGMELGATVNLADIIKDEAEVQKKLCPREKEKPRVSKSRSSKKLDVDGGKESSCEQNKGTPGTTETERKGWNIAKHNNEEFKEASSPTKSPGQSFLESRLGSSPEPSFHSIMQAEVSESKNLRRSLNKPLHLIQLEERAIEELLEFYGGSYNPDEFVTVTRVKSTMAKPLWKK